jgi:hypothetical protein
MPVLSVQCQHCGAPLSLADEVRFVTCNFCQTPLEVVHDASVTHTKLLEKMVSLAGDSNAHLEILTLQNDLQRLEDEWISHRDSVLMLRNPKGKKVVPTRRQADINMVVQGAVVFAGFIYTMSTFMQGQSAWPFWLLVTGIAGVAVYLIHSHAHMAANRYSLAYGAYRTQQEAIMQRISELRRMGGG